MKKNRLLEIFAGITFFILAIFFSFSLLYSLFETNSSIKNFSTLMASTGTMIRATYGLCSILIPIFFFTVAMICLSGQISFKSCIYISFSLIPFFTAVISEKLYKNSSVTIATPFGIVKLIITIISTILIMGIEFLLSGIIAERIVLYKKKKQFLQNQPNDEAYSENQIESLTANSSFSNLSTQTYINEKTKNNSQDTNEQSTISSEYAHAFDDVPLYDDFSAKEIITDDADESSLDDELDNYNSFLDDETQIEILNTQDFEELNIKDVYSNPDDAAIEETNNFESDDNDDFQIDNNSSDENLTDETLEIDNINNNDELNNEDMNYDDENIDDNIIFDDDLSQDENDLNNIDNLDANNQDNDEYNFENDNLDNDNYDEDNFDDNHLDENNVEYSNFDESEINNEENNQQLNQANFDDSSIISSVFSKMENDIKENSAQEENQISVKQAEEEIKQEKKLSREKRHGPYKIPTSGLLNDFEDQQYWIIDNKTHEAAAQLKDTLEEFKIAAEVTGIRKGPVVTMFEILPAPGVKLSKIVSLQDNIALRLAASSVRIVAPIPGKRAVGIEVPNENRAIVTFRELIEQNLSEYKKMAVPVVLGKDIQGEAQLLDIAKTPHLLIAGSTGSGKSVCVNSIILSILYKRTPNEVKLILVDPKIVELKLYNDIPHLLTPVITEPKKALQSLQYCLCEMERRYALLDGLGVRDIISYNKRIEERHIATEKLPYIVVIIDEFADLMATTGKELESTIARLCAMSRAVGIHLVLATQRPSIDVITGLIKANIPTRIAFMVASKMDSRIIIDQVGAEKLLGRGDMLYASATDPFPVRIQGTFVSDREVENVVEYVKSFGEPEYIDDEIFVDDDEDAPEPSLFGDGDDPLYNKALEIVMEAGKASASYIQRRLKVGYNRAARLVEEMEARGIVGPANGSKPREIIHIP